MLVVVDGRKDEKRAAVESFRKIFRLNSMRNCPVSSCLKPVELSSRDDVNINVNHRLLT